MSGFEGKPAQQEDSTDVSACQAFHGQGTRVGRDVGFSHAMVARPLVGNTALQVNEVFPSHALRLPACNAPSLVF
jgi:hypothetical protein